MKENVSSLLLASQPNKHADPHLITCLGSVSSWAESEAGVVRAGPEGAGPQRASVALHLPCAAPRPAQRQRHASQNLHSPQEVRVTLQDRNGRRLLKIYTRSFFFACLLACVLSHLIMCTKFRFRSLQACKWKCRVPFTVCICSLTHLPLCPCMQRVERLHDPTPPWWHGHGGVHRHQSVLVRWGPQHQSPASVMELPGKKGRWTERLPPWRSGTFLCWNVPKAKTPMQTKNTIAKHGLHSGRVIWAQRQIRAMKTC